MAANHVHLTSGHSGEDDIFTYSESKFVSNQTNILTKISDLWKSQTQLSRSSIPKNLGVRDELEPMHQSKCSYELINHSSLISKEKKTNNPIAQKAKEENQILKILHNNIIHTQSRDSIAVLPTKTSQDTYNLLRDPSNGEMTPSESPVVTNTNHKIKRIYITSKMR